MCVAVSGRCFTSQFLFGEKASANRGKCLHPCRRSYTVKDDIGNKLKLENKTIMSAKDLCALPFIEKIKKAGVKSIKIEGRNKEPEYVSRVVGVYRKALDKKLSEKEVKQGLNELSKAYNKGFSSGFLIGIPGNKDFANVEDNLAKESKRFIGKIEHYFTKQEVAAIKMNAGKIKVGDEILALGKNIGVIRQKVERIEIHNKAVDSGEKGQLIAIKIPGAKKGNEIYKVIKRR